MGGWGWVIEWGVGECEGGGGRGYFVNVATLRAWWGRASEIGCRCASCTSNAQNTA